MSLNLGPVAFDGIQNLKNNRDWEHFREGLQEAMERQMNAAVEVPWDQRADATGYARALRDLVVAIELCAGGPAASRNWKPSVKARAPGSSNG